MQPTNWQCPFCWHHTTITDARVSEDVHKITLPSKLGHQRLYSRAIACPNEQCKELFVRVTLAKYVPVSGGNDKVEAPHSVWVLRPVAEVRPFPAYVPEAIRADYAEAKQILHLSPKASAALSRRCLQGMIRDFWSVKEKDLFHEIKALQGKVDSKTWQALDAVRTIGNIGAHMEKDINLIVDVGPGEAQLLVELIERLIEDWYVERHEHDARMDKMIAAAQAKTAQRKAPPSGAPATENVTSPPADTDTPPPGEPAQD